MDALSYRLSSQSFSAPVDKIQEILFTNNREKKVENSSLLSIYSYGLGAIFEWFTQLKLRVCAFE